MVKCNECSQCYFNSETKEVECGLSAEDSNKCPNLVNEEE